MSIPVRTSIWTYLKATTHPLAKAEKPKLTVPRHCILLIELPHGFLAKPRRRASKHTSCTYCISLSHDRKFIYKSRKRKKQNGPGNTWPDLQVYSELNRSTNHLFTWIDGSSLIRWRMPRRRAQEPKAVRERHAGVLFISLLLLNQWSLSWPFISLKSKSMTSTSTNQSTRVPPLSLAGDGRSPASCDDRSSRAPTAAVHCDSAAARSTRTPGVSWCFSRWHKDAL